MRTVIDTNVLLSGLVWRGAPHRLIEQIRVGAITLISSPALIAELGRVVTRPKFSATLARASIAPEQLVDEVRWLAELIEPKPLFTRASRDVDDDAVLALADAARPDLIVSGDSDLLVLGSYAAIPIVTPAQALAILGTPLT